MAGYAPDASTTDWCTPNWIIEKVHEVFGGPPELDPCSNEWSKVNPSKAEYKLPHNDGLAEHWDYKTIFVNPPYGKGYVNRETLAFATPKEFRVLPERDKVSWRLSTLENWLARCAFAWQQNHSDVIALCPAYVDTAAWQNYVWPYVRYVFFPRGRIKFDLPPVQCEILTAATVADEHLKRCTSKADWFIRRGKGADSTRVAACDRHRFHLIGKHKRWNSEAAPMACALPFWGSENTGNRFYDIFGDSGQVVKLG